MRHAPDGFKTPLLPRCQSVIRAQKISASISSGYHSIRLLAMIRSRDQRAEKRRPNEQKLGGKKKKGRVGGPRLATGQLGHLSGKEAVSLEGVSNQ